MMGVLAHAEIQDMPAAAAPECPKPDSAVVRPEVRKDLRHDRSPALHAQHARGPSAQRTTATGITPCSVSMASKLTAKNRAKSRMAEKKLIAIHFMADPFRLNPHLQVSKGGALNMKGVMLAICHSKERNFSCIIKDLRV